MKPAENRTLHIRVILGLTLLATIVLYFMPAIPQPPEYHRFADSRTFLGLPNFLNVASNLLFLPASAYGLKLLFDRRSGMQRAQFAYPMEIIPYAIFFAGAALTCFGSVFYHMLPDNFSLVWDRLPMSIMFASFLTIVISERIHRSASLFILPGLILFGVFSIYQWYESELIGAGDLRLYILFQFLPVILIAYMLFFFPSRYSRSDRFGWILLLYVAAKAAEFFDADIFALHGWISGHTIKHILAAMAVFALAEMLRCRISINRDQRSGSELDQY